MSVANNKDVAREDSSIRVSADRIARIMDMVGELGLIADEVVHHPSLENIELEEFDNSAHKLNQIIREIQDEASGLRLVTIGTVFKRMHRLVRDLSKQTGKSVDLTIKGEETEIDKVVVDILSEPLVHLIRNSIDHGIEEKEQRLAKGKDEKGRVWLTASQSSSDILIVLKDDGQGLNKNKIIAKAKANRLIHDASHLSDADIYNLIFEPGFSTKEQVSQLSGRGVGMDVVRTTIQSLRGKISIESEEGKGTTFKLLIPLSVAFLETMIVRVKSRLYALPIEAVVEVLRPEEGNIIQCRADGSRSIEIRNSIVPIRSLEQLFDEKETEQLGSRILLVVGSSVGDTAIPIDEIYGQFQASIKPMAGQLEGIRAANGCALLPNGNIAILLDNEQVARWVVE